MQGALPPPSCDAASRPTLWLGQGYAGYLGPALTIDPHSTAVACLGVGIDSPFTFRAAPVGDVTARSAYSPARHEHQLIPRRGRMLFVFLEPTSLATVDYTVHMRRVIGPFGFDHRAEDQLVAASQDQNVDFGRILRHLYVSVPRIMDPRIKEAIRTVRADPRVRSAPKSLPASWGCPPRTSYDCSAARQRPVFAAISCGPE